MYGLVRPNQFIGGDAFYTMGSVVVYDLILELEGGWRILRFQGCKPNIWGVKDRHEVEGGLS